MKWNLGVVMKCPLCKEVEDSRDHLFFQCKYSKQVWSSVKDLGNLGNSGEDWLDIENMISMKKANGNIWSVIQRLIWAASVTVFGVKEMVDCLESKRGQLRMWLI